MGTSFEDGIVVEVRSLGVEFECCGEVLSE